eukprot:g1354.t1
MADVKPSSTIELRSVRVDTSSTSSKKAEEEESKKVALKKILETKSVQQELCAHSKTFFKGSGDEKESRSIRSACTNILKYNASKIYEAWDVDNDNHLDLREIQLGLANVGMLVPKTKILYVANKVSQRSNTKGYVLAREFPDFMIELCDDEIDVIRDIVTKLAGKVPKLRAGIELKWLDIMGRRKSSEDMELAMKEDSEKNKEVMSKRFRKLTSQVKEERSRNQALRPAVVVFEMLTFQRGVLPAFLMFMLWQFGFTLFYVLYDEFRFDRAFYYSAQAGLSVGFGALTEEVTGGVKKYDANCSLTNGRDSGEYDVSKFITVLNILLGSSVIGGALGYFIDSAIQSKERWYEQLMERDEKKKKTKVASAATPSMSQWCRDWYRDNRTVVKLISGVVALIVAGVIYGMAYEDWTFISSIYFGITAMSTGGLQTPSTDDPLAVLFCGVYVLIGVPLYGCCLGLFANGLIDKVQARKEEDQEKAFVSKMEFNMTQHVRALGGDGGGGSNEESSSKEKTSSEDDNDSDSDDDDDSANWREEAIEKYDFILMELLRTGKIDLDFIKYVDKKFEEFDADRSGTISWNEIVAFNAFEAIDSDGSGFVDFDEFVELMKHMSSLISNAKFDTDEASLRHTFDRIESAGRIERNKASEAEGKETESNDGKLSRREFGAFVDAVLSGEIAAKLYMDSPVVYAGMSAKERREKIRAMKRKAA